MQKNKQSVYAGSQNLLSVTRVREKNGTEATDFSLWQLIVLDLFRNNKHAVFMLYVLLEAFSCSCELRISGSQLYFLVDSLEFFI